jgi:hypothetical protein
VLQIELSSSWDWDDLELLVEPQPDGTQRVTYYGGDGNTNNNFAGQTYEMLDANQQPIATNFSYGQSIPMLPSSCSYGVHPNIADPATHRSTKIMLVEYKKLIADVVTPNGADVWQDQVAPRHLNSLNMMLYDGSVRTVRPSEIDPTIPQYQADYWQPE